MEGCAKSFRVPALDGIRAYAIAAVVVVHLLGASGVLASADGTELGVWIWGFFGGTIDVFFIISAFVLFLPAVRRGGELGSAGGSGSAAPLDCFRRSWLVIGLMLILVAVVPPGERLRVPVAEGDRRLT